MTEKEKMLRALLYEAAFFVQLHTEEAGEMNEPVTDLDNRIAKALADTEDTGGEKCPWCGHNKSTVQISGERYCNKCDKLIEHLPPKEQDDEAMENIVRKAVGSLEELNGEPFHGYRSEVWSVVSLACKAACKQR